MGNAATADQQHAEAAVDQITTFASAGASVQVRRKQSFAHHAAVSWQPPNP
jgi:hypothetical protein